jgi:hypothetical protein
VIVKKSASRVIGAHLTNAEKKAMDIEIQKELAEWTRKHEREIVAMILRQAKRTFKPSKKALKNFFLDFDKGIDALGKKYEMGAMDDDDAWLCTRELKEAGIDLDEWYKELE